MTINAKIGSIDKQQKSLVPKENNPNKRKKWEKLNFEDSFGYAKEELSIPKENNSNNRKKSNLNPNLVYYKRKKEDVKTQQPEKDPVQEKNNKFLNFKQVELINSLLNQIKSIDPKKVNTQELKHIVSFTRMIDFVLEGKKEFKNIIPIIEYVNNNFYCRKETLTSPKINNNQPVPKSPQPPQTEAVIKNNDRDLQDPDLQEIMELMQKILDDPNGQNSQEKKYLPKTLKR